MDDMDDKGIDQAEERIGAPDAKQELDDTRESKPFLFEITMGAAGKHVVKRWEGLNKVTRGRLAEARVNWVRYKGLEPFAQLNPTDSTRLWTPPKGKRSQKAPTINQIPRAVDRYVAQVTADDPVMEGVPVSHRDEDRDAAEAASQALAGEHYRLRQTTELQRLTHAAAVLRSAFWYYQWDDMAGGMQPAHKFFDAPNGDRVLLPVDKDGKEVDDISKAAKIQMGNVTQHMMTLANVRWYGSRGVREASEVMVGELVTLAELYEMDPKAKDVKLSELLHTSDVTHIDGMEWLQDIRGESESGTKRDFNEDSFNRTGHSLEDQDSMLDEKVLVINYFQPPTKKYKKGVHIRVAGKYCFHRDSLRYGVVPVAQLKFLDELDDQTGRSLVDILRDPQELLDFVNGQVLRFLQMMKRRWFVPIHSGVKARDLLTPTQSMIEFNPAAGAPIPEQQPEIPNSLMQYIERFDGQFNDQLGVHDSTQGKHVPGVASGRHVDALRTGDETLLGLTRAQMVDLLQDSSEIILAMIKKEWTMERRVRFLGEDREYVDAAFTGNDFGDTTSVRLKRGTLLMLTPAQRFESVMMFLETGLVSPEEARGLAPMLDVAGASTSEDTHYQHARRQNRRFLLGPPKRLVAAEKKRAEALEILAQQQDDVTKAMEIGGSLQDIEIANARIAMDMDNVESEWAEVLDRYDFDHGRWQDSKEVARIHGRAHAEALASSKVERFPEWWVELFTAHAVLEWELGFPEEVLERAQVQSQVAAAAAALNPPPPDPNAQAPVG